MMDKIGILIEGNFLVNYYESFIDELNNEEILSLFVLLESNFNYLFVIGIVDFVKGKNILYVIF